jgi:hypothetical protein
VGSTLSIEITVEASGASVPGFDLILGFKAV